MIQKQRQRKEKKLNLRVTHSHSYIPYVCSLLLGWTTHSCTCKLQPKLIFVYVSCLVEQRKGEGGRKKIESNTITLLHLSLRSEWKKTTRGWNQLAECTFQMNSVEVIEFHCTKLSTFIHRRNKKKYQKGCESWWGLKKEKENKTKSKSTYTYSHLHCTCQEV